MSLEPRQISPALLQSLPSAIQTPLQELSNDLQLVLGTQLTALVLYGGVLRGRYQQSSDVNLLILVDNADHSILMQMEPALTRARRSINLDPFILETHELSQVADVFSIKLSTIKREHRVLFGDDVLSQVEVDNEHIRLNLEQGLRNILLRLRAKVAGMGHDQLSLRRHLQQMTRPLAIHLQEYLWLLKGPDQPDVPHPTDQIFKLAAETLGLSQQPFDRLVNLRNGLKDSESEWNAVADQLLNSLKQIIEKVDELEVTR